MKIRKQVGLAVIALTVIISAVQFTNNKIKKESEKMKKKKKVSLPMK
jgi:hypothetical protein